MVPHWRSLPCRLISFRMIARVCVWRHTRARRYLVLVRDSDGDEVNVEQWCDALVLVIP